MPENNIKEIYKKPEVTSDKSSKSSSVIIFVIIIIAGLIYNMYEIKTVSNKVSEIKISDDKIDYVYNKINDLVKILDTKEEMDVSYNPTEQYDFKPSGDELVADQPETAQENNQALREELKKMKAGDKIKIVRDKLVDIFQQSKIKDEEMTALKQSFYDVKQQVEAWYNDTKGVKKTVSSDEAQGGGLIGKLKRNIGNYVEVKKIDDDMKGKKVLSSAEIPQMLYQAEILIESGSIPQTIWIMEDIETITKLERIKDFTSKAEKYIEKYPNPNSEIQKIKELIDIIENQE